MNPDNYIASLALFSSIIGLLLIYKQIKISIKNNEENFAKRTAETTLNHYTKNRDEFRRHNDKIIKELKLDNEHILTEKEVKEIIDEPELSDSIKFIFSYLSNFSTGEKYGIYDINILSDLSGKSFVTIFNRYYPYVQYKRKVYYSGLYKILEDMIERIANIKDIKVNWKQGDMQNKL